jgi:hypothetical protein
MTKEVKEGYCEVCENFGVIEEHDGKLVCKECAEEEGIKDKD